MRMLVLFGVIWSAFALAMDGFVFYNAARQVLAVRFPSTQGVVLSSEITHQRGSKGTTYGVAIRYAYSVGEKKFEGDRLRYGAGSSSDSDWATQAVREYPKGAQATIFYNPSDPADSVLRTGVEGCDLFLMLFSMPFNGVMLGIWWGCWASLRKRWFKPVAGGAKITHQLRQTHVCVSELSPLAIGVATVCFLAFFAMFIVAFCAGGFHPSMRTMGLAWGTILAAGGGVTLWFGLRQKLGRYDLVLDDLSGTVELPAICGRKERLRLSWSSITGVRIEERMSRIQRGSSSAIYAILLEIHDPTFRTEAVAEWYDKDRAEGLKQWLREKFKLADKPKPGSI